MILVSRRKTLKPGLRLFGFADSFWTDRAACCEKLLLKVERRHGESFPRLVDRLTNFIQIFDGRRDGGACPAITIVIKQTPFA